MSRSKRKMKDIELNLLNNNILIELVEEEGKNNKIIIPDAYKKKINKAKILKVGKKITQKGIKVDYDFKEGDLVIIDPYSVKKIFFKGEEYCMIPENAILCVIEE